MHGRHCFCRHEREHLSRRSCAYRAASVGKNASNYSDSDVLTAGRCAGASRNAPFLYRGLRSGPSSGGPESAPEVPELTRGCLVFRRPSTSRVGKAACSRQNTLTFTGAARRLGDAAERFQNGARPAVCSSRSRAAGLQQAARTIGEIVVRGRLGEFQGGELSDAGRAL